MPQVDPSGSPPPLEIRLRSQSGRSVGVANLEDSQSQLAAAREERRRRFLQRSAPPSSGTPEPLATGTPTDAKAQLAAAREERRRRFLEQSSPPAIPSPEEPVAPEPLERCRLEAEEARTMLSECNSIRSCNGCDALLWSSRLAAIAERSALRMARGEVPFSHDGADERFAEYPLGPGDTYGENLARIEGVHPMAHTVAEGWRKSPGHCKNLLGPFTACGIGAATNVHGVTFVVQMLGRVPGDARPPPETAASEMTPASLSRLQHTSVSRVLLQLILFLAILLWGGGWLRWPE